MPRINNSKFPVQSDVLLENPRKKQLTGTGERSATNLSVKMGVAQRDASTSNLMKPIVEIDSALDFEMNERIRPLIHKVKLIEIIYLVFPFD